MSETIKTPPDRDSAQWAEANVVLPPGSARSGPYSTNLTPYIREIAAALHDPRTRWGVLVMASQSGKTQAVLNLIGHKISDNPAPVLYIGPTQKNINDKIEPRVMTLIRGAKVLRERFRGGKASTKTVKRIGGVDLMLGWAGSPTELASAPAELVVIDELDRMKPTKEGTVTELASARMETYPDSLGVIDSTPTEGTCETYVDEHGIERWKPSPPEDIGSATWQHWQEGSREEFAMPCPHCDHYFVPRFKLMTWDDGLPPTEAAQTARLTCPHCGSAIGDEHRARMVDRGTFLGPGQWIANGQKLGKLLSRSKRSFWVSGLASKISPWPRRVEQWLLAARSKEEERIRAALNTLFGELYQLKGDAPDWEIVKRCAGEYDSGTAPRGVQRIFVTVDVQQDRLVYVVRGWGWGFESWGIEADELWAVTETRNRADPCWQHLEQLLDRTWDGKAVAAMAIDSGFNTDTVDWFAKRNSRVLAFVGSRGKPARLYSSRAQEVTNQGRTIKSGHTRWTVDHGHFKAWLYERMRRPQDAAGAWHVARDMATDDYCKQVTAETAIRLPSGRVDWRKIRSDNHFLDCEYAQVFLAHQQRVGDLQPLDAEPQKKSAAPKKKTGWVGKRRSWMR